MSTPSGGGYDDSAYDSSSDGPIVTSGDQDIAVPANSDERIVIDRLIATATSAQPFIIKYGSTTLLTANVQASDTIDLPALYLAAPYGSTVVITIPASGSPSALVFFHRERKSL